MTALVPDPLAGECPDLLANYPANSDIGRNIRRGDASLRLRQMSEVELTVAEQEKVTSEIRDSLDRLRASHELNMQYLLEFGVVADHRKHFRDILEEVCVNGELSLLEAAELASLQAAQGDPENPYS